MRVVLGTLLVSAILSAQPAFFIPQNPITVGSSPSSLVIGDFNGDGKGRAIGIFSRT